MSRTTIEVTDGQKESVKALQDHLEEALGTRPTQGEAVAIACEKFMGNIE